MSKYLLSSKGLLMDPLSTTWTTPQASSANLKEKKKAHHSLACKFNCHTPAAPSKTTPSVGWLRREQPACFSLTNARCVPGVCNLHPKPLAGLCPT